MNQAKYYLLTTTMVSLVATMPSFAADITWTNASGDGLWNTPSNWSNNAGATNPDDAVVNSGTALINADISTQPRDIKVGIAGGQTGIVNHTAGTASSGSGNWTFIGTGGTGHYNISGGTLSGPGDARLLLGGANYFAAGNGTLSVSGSGIVDTRQIYVGAQGPSGAVGNLNVSGGSVTHRQDLFVGMGSGHTGNVNISGGSLNMSNGWAFIGVDGGTANVSQTGGTVNYNNFDNRTYIGGSSGTATYDISGGTLHSQSLWVGSSTDRTPGLGVGTLKVSGTAVVNANRSLQIGIHGSRGHVDQTGGTVNVNAGWFGIGNDDNTGSSGSTYSLSGGSLNINNGITAEIGADTAATFTLSGSGHLNSSGSVFVGFRSNGNGTLNMTGGKITTNDLVVGNSGTATGTMNLDGGTIEAHRIRSGTGAGQVNFNGATFKTRSGQSELFPNLTAANSEIKSGGLIIDTNGFDSSTSVPLDGPGGLTKQGLGTLTLNGANTYTGKTVISAGTLALGATGSLSPSSEVTVAAGAIYDGSASAAGITIPAGQTLDGGTTAMPGNVLGNVTVLGTLAPGNSIGTLNITGNLTLSGTSNFEFSPSSAADLVIVSGTLSLGGTFNFTNLGSTPAQFDTFNVFDAGTTTGSFTTTNLPSYAAGDFWINNLAVDGTLQYIPEASSSALLGLVATLGLARRRRRA